MNLIRLAIGRPIAVVAAVLMTVLFGLLALQTIPIQLTPDVRRPVITVRTTWPGASPAEIEREILNKQEETLRGLEGLVELRGQAQDGEARTTLEFAVGQDMDKALLLVANRLDRVGGYPDEAEEPTLDTAGSEDTPITWISITRDPENTRNMYTYGDFVEDTVRDRLERVEGVAGVNVYGGRNRELVVTVDPVGMSRYGLTVPEVVAALRAADVATTAGDVEEGKRRYVVRTDSELNDARGGGAGAPAFQPRSRHRPHRPHHGGRHRGCGLRVQGPKRRMIRRLGEPSVVVNAVRETGANVIETMKGIREALAELAERYAVEGGEAGDPPGL